jgi:putative ABC transport system substrate-binding protein
VRTYRLGFLVLSPRDEPLNAHFLDELRRLSFVEGQNLTVEYRAYGQHIDLISQYAAELVNARVDVIVVAEEEAIHALQQATKTIPIVALGGDLLGVGLREIVVAARAIQRASAFSHSRLTANDRTS